MHDPASAHIVTLTVERHNGALWLCATADEEVRLLARFGDEASADAYKRAVNLRDRAMHEAGRLGL